MPKKILFLLIFGLIVFPIDVSFSATLKILLVDDDNNSSPDHLPTIEQAIIDAGYTYDLFNAQDSARSPDATLMSKYNLVFWYCANDGVGGYFWSGTDTVNTELVNYLDNGGWLWVMGNDVIYDMYGKPPDTLQAGDFLYDYLGIQSYDVQSKGDDGGVGVPMLIRIEGQDICTAPDTIRWKFSGLWWADGCTPRAEAVPVYKFGDESYVLADYPTAIFYENGTFKTLGTHFDAYYIAPDEDRVTFFKSVLDYFSSQLAPTFPPTQFSLLQPEDNKWLDIGKADEKIHFSWQNSTDPDGTNLTYRLYLATTPDVSESAILEKDTTAANYDLANSELYGFVAEGDTLELYWSVRAKDEESETTWASDTFKVTVVRIENQPPLAFNLYVPENNSQYIVNTLQDSLLFTWEPPQDPEGGPLNKTFYYWLNDNDSMVTQIEVLTHADSLFFSNSTFLDLLAGADSLTFHWTVKACDVFGAMTAANDTFALIVVNNYNVITKGPELQTPQDFMHLFFVEDQPTQIEFNWQAAEAYRNPTYTFRILDMAGNVLFEADTSETTFTFDFKDLLKNTTTDTVAFLWDVVATLEDTVQEASINGPFTIIFVQQMAQVMVVFDDNYSNHNEVIREALNAINLNYVDFDCGNDGSGYPAQIPTFEQLKENDLVFWFTGNDGKRLALWQGQDTVNTDLKQYLDSGGKLWVAGIDFLYDKYGGAADTFLAGDFVYDYLGIRSYDAQSKKDDDGQGVPLVYLDHLSAPEGIASIDTLTWKYSTLWYVDAITPVEGAKVVYRMGPSDYALADAPVYICYQTPEFLTLTTTFNPRQFKEDNDRLMLKRFLFEGLNWLQNQVLTDVSNNQTALPLNFAVQQNYPNPFNPSTTIPVALPSSGKVRLVVFNVLGQKVLQKDYKLNAGRHLLKINGMRLASGIYYYQIKFKNRTVTRKMVFLK